MLPGEGVLDLQCLCLLKHLFRSKQRSLWIPFGKKNIPRTNALDKLPKSTKHARFEISNGERVDRFAAINALFVYEE